jgi:type IV pilus assembly protein PilW
MMKYFMQHNMQQTGLSLLELMIAMSLGLMVTLSLGYIMIGSQSTYRSQDASARMQDTGRFALEYIGRELMKAGSTADLSVIVNGGEADFEGEADIDGDSDQLMVTYQIRKDDGTYDIFHNEVCYDAAGDEIESDCRDKNDPFAENVQELRFRYQSSDGSWGDVANANTVAVEVCFMLASASAGIVSEPQTILDCDGEESLRTDTKLYRTFSSVFALRNRINAAP